MILSDSLRITAMIPPTNHKMYPPMTIGATDVDANRIRRISPAVKSTPLTTMTPMPTLPLTTGLRG